MSNYAKGFLTVEEITHVTAEDGQDSIVAILANKIDKVFAHVSHEFMFGNMQQLEKERKKMIKNELKDGSA